MGGDVWDAFDAAAIEGGLREFARIGFSGSFYLRLLPFPEGFFRRHDTDRIFKGGADPEPDKRAFGRADKLMPEIKKRVGRHCLSEQAEFESSSGYITKWRSKHYALAFATTERTI